MIVRNLKKYNENRVKILSLCYDWNYAYSMRQKVDSTQASISQEISKLINEGLLKTRRESLLNKRLVKLTEKGKKYIGWIKEKEYLTKTISKIDDRLDMILGEKM